MDPLRRQNWVWLKESIYPCLFQYCHGGRQWKRGLVWMVSIQPGISFLWATFVRQEGNLALLRFKKMCRLSSHDTFYHPWCFHSQNGEICHWKDITRTKSVLNCCWQINFQELHVWKWNRKLSCLTELPMPCSVMSRDIAWTEAKGLWS